LDSDLKQDLVLDPWALRWHILKAENPSHQRAARVAQLSACYSNMKSASGVAAIIAYGFELVPQL